MVWDLDGKRYIDFQNGWATNPLGNCHPETLEVVEAANRRYGFHYDHPLRYDLAEMLADILPGSALLEQITKSPVLRPPKPLFTWRSRTRSDGTSSRSALPTMAWRWARRY